MEPKDRNDELVHANVEAFANALGAGRARVDRPDFPSAIHAILDASDQDDATIALLAELGCPRTALVCAALPDGAAAEEEILRHRYAELEARGLDCTLIRPATNDNLERVHAAEARDAWFLIPCPFAHDFDELAHKTLGTAVEVALTDAVDPVLIVRGMLGAAAAEPLQRPHLVARSFDHASARAARIALGLLAGSPGKAIRGTLSMSFVHEGEPAGDAADAIDAGFEIAPETLLPLLGHGLSALLHRLDEMRHAEGNDFDLELRLVTAAGAMIDEANEFGRLHIVPMRSSKTGVPDAIHDFVLSCEDPVLVVPPEAKPGAPRT